MKRASTLLLPIHACPKIPKCREEAPSNSERISSSTWKIILKTAGGTPSSLMIPDGAGLNNASSTRRRSSIAKPSYLSLLLSGEEEQRIVTPTSRS